MAAQILDTAVVTAPVNVIHQVEFLKRAEQVAAHFVGSTPANLRQHGGTFTAQWRRIENLTPTTTALTELNGNVAFPTRDSVVPTMTDVTATVAKYGQYFAPNEEMNLVNFDNTTAELLAVLAHSAGRSLNMLQRNELEDNSTIVYAGGVASDGAVVSGITLATIKSVINTLARNSATPFTPITPGSENTGTAPILPSYWAICHPDVAEDVAGLTGFKSAEVYGSQTQLAMGEFGYIGRAGRGVRFVQSEDSSIDSGSGGTTGSTGLRGATNIDLYTTVILGMNAHGSLGFGTSHVQSIYKAGDALPSVQLINKPMGSAGSADPFDELSSLAWKSWHAAKILNGNWVRGIRSGATSL